MEKRGRSSFRMEKRGRSSFRMEKRGRSSFRQWEKSYVPFKSVRSLPPLPPGEVARQGRAGEGAFEG
jgi:hypothetical protein